MIKMIQLPFIKDKTFAVLGLGKTGRSVVDALENSGNKVIIFDDKNCEFDGSAVLPKIDALIVSPGVAFSWPEMHPLVRYARANLIPVFSDLDLFFSAVDKPVIGITGTNGKSTTTALIWHILKENGYNVDVGGNFGVPVLEMSNNADVYVIELSSYQLELSTNLNCYISVLLNITPDHLHRHGGMYGYVAAKEKIFLNSKINVISLDDDYCMKIYDFINKVDTIKISGLNSKVADIGWVGDSLYDFKNKQFICSTTRYLEGTHNKQNIAAGYAALSKFGISINEFKKGLESFHGLEHRQEIVVNNAVNFLIINDSKATNADAVEQAFLRFKDLDILWIVGGRQKEGGILSLKKYFHLISKAFLIGESQEEFYELLQENKVKSQKCDILEVAVKEALLSAKEFNNPVILFSPACASFDQFKSFEERGELFKKYVEGFLKNGIY